MKMNIWREVSITDTGYKYKNYKVMNTSAKWIAHTHNFKMYLQKQIDQTLQLETDIHMKWNNGLEIHCQRYQTQC